MATWKKVVVSGSSAELAGLTVDATIVGDINGNAATATTATTATTAGTTTTNIATTTVLQSTTLSTTNTTKKRQLITV